MESAPSRSFENVVPLKRSDSGSLSGATGPDPVLDAKATRAARVPREMAIARGTAPAVARFPMTGAQVFARACVEEELAALFCASGNYEVVHALAEAGVPAFGGRRESAMAHAADAFVRVTGELALCSASRGPGLVEMLSGIASAGAARTPLLVVTGHAPSGSDDSAFQYENHDALGGAMLKYRRVVESASQVHECAATAFRQVKSGLPRPVQLDLLPDAVTATVQSPAELLSPYGKERYRTSAQPHPAPKQVEAAIDLLRKARRPLIVSSNGVFYGKAWEALAQVARRGDIPVVESGAMKGQFSDDDPLCANAAPGALPAADVVLLVGQHCTPRPEGFAFGAETRYLRIDPYVEEMGRNLPIDVGVVSGERAGLEALADLMPQMSHPSWVAEVAKHRAAFAAENDAYYAKALSHADCIHPAALAKHLADFLYRGPIAPDATTVVSGGYGAARYIRRWLRGYRPGQVMNGPYHYGAVGPDVAYLFGVAVAVELGVGPQRAYRGSPAVCVTGDAGFGYSAMELDTLCKYDLPAVVIVFNNGASGSWTRARCSPRSIPIHLYQEDLRYDKLAESLGAYGEYVDRAADLPKALERAYDFAVAHCRPAVINCRGRKEFWSTPPGILPKVEPGCMSYYY